ncbi:MAG: hypothetical protein AMJ95_04925 [Omnitrophica WOR_2 bacterium SM23_72]|nr:MAG: hypothetical protein AMJ95_04925 [Omnitrophica WOR_2 bacterium SM23_72]
MKKKMILLCLAAMFMAMNAFADTVTLKSGQEIEGRIIDRTDESVKMESFGVEVTYFMDEVDKINGESVVASVQDAQDVSSVAQEDTDALIESKGLGSADIPEQVEEMPVSLTGESRQRLTPSQAATLATGVSSTFAIFTLLFFVYTAFCLQMIAKKTSQGPVWLAWVPIGNLFLMCKIGSLSYLWLLGILLSLLPFVGVFFGLGLCAYIWYRIALALNKPGWIGALACLPLANLVVMGYLAFSE